MSFHHFPVFFISSFPTFCSSPLLLTSLSPSLPFSPSLPLYLSHTHFFCLFLPFSISLFPFYISLFLSLSISVPLPLSALPMFLSPSLPLPLSLQHARSFSLSSTPLTSPLPLSLFVPLYPCSSLLLFLFPFLSLFLSSLSPSLSLFPLSFYEVPSTPPSISLSFSASIPLFRSFPFSLSHTSIFCPFPFTF